MEKTKQPITDTLQTITTRKKTILVVDDNTDILDLTKTVLELDNYEVLAAKSGKEALSILNEVNKPDLILLDLLMEEMSGPEFLEELEQSRPEIFESVPVVFLSGIDKVPVSKAVGFIKKPFDLDNFLVAVHGFIEKGTSQELFKH